jgi:C-methyltransferase C-terminal domain
MTGHAYGIDAERFPLAVDSDPEKVGTFVPGTGQQIVFRDALLRKSVDVILIPSPWRARDIVEEARRIGIRFEKVLIEHCGRLIDYFRDPHPYYKPAHASSVEEPHVQAALQIKDLQPSCKGL